MAWARLDDGILDHPKILRAGEDAAAIFIKSIIYCCKHLTDGEVPREALFRLTSKPNAEALAARLVEVGLWYDRNEKGWEIHDFGDWNPTRKSVRDKRAQNAERQRRYREKKAKEKAEKEAAARQGNDAPVTPHVTRYETQDQRVENSAPSHPIPSHVLREEPPYSPPAPQGDAPAAPASRSRKARELSEGSLAVQAEIRERLGVEYPPSAFDALEARLRSKDLTADDAIAIARFACADPFWGAEVKANPSTLYRPKHWASLLAQARAGPSKAPQVRTQFSGREPIPDEYARLR